jgi:hypothetical protein
MKKAYENPALIKLIQFYQRNLMAEVIYKARPFQEIKCLE